MLAQLVRCYSACSSCSKLIDNSNGTSATNRSPDRLRVSLRALLVTFPGILCVIPAFLGRWNLGRAVIVVACRKLQRHSVHICSTAPIQMRWLTNSFVMSRSQVRYGAVAMADGRAVDKMNRSYGMESGRNRKWRV